ncbi:integrase core domain-containing protein [Serratia ureilytica]|uniref:integrase core domain-containing protein n=1 Tax=Serratia ureilytica TaxID=300181 RepID=UPI00396A59BF
MYNRLMDSTSTEVITHVLSQVKDARKIINDWRQDYNECRPNSALNYQTPSEFAALWRNGKCEGKQTDITN